MVTLHDKFLLPSSFCFCFLQIAILVFRFFPSCSIVWIYKFEELVGVLCLTQESRYISVTIDLQARQTERLFRATKSVGVPDGPGETL